MQCDCQYWSPRVVDPAFYAEGHQQTYDRRRKGEVFLRPRHRMFLRRNAPSRLFDIGCGEGGFLEEARTRGFEVAGLDLDEGNVEAARKRGLRIDNAMLVDRGQLAPSLRGQRYDRVTAFDVLEHQADPIEFLRAARELLDADGMLCGSVPNRDRILAARDRSHNLGDLPPHHFLWFSPTSLETTLRRVGFTQVTVLPIPETDAVTFAAYIQIAIIGRALGRGGRDRPAGTSSKNRGMRLGSTIKNLPFVPLAFAVNAVTPGKVRNLYFEARA